MKGLGNVDLGARYPIFQYVTKDNQFDTIRLGVALEVGSGIPTNTVMSKSTELVPKIFSTTRESWQEHHLSVHPRILRTLRRGRRWHSHARAWGDHRLRHHASGPGDSRPPAAYAGVRDPMARSSSTRRIRERTLFAAMPPSRFNLEQPGTDSTASRRGLRLPDEQRGARRTPLGNLHEPGLRILSRVV